MSGLPFVDWENNVVESPHVVLLGAGASKACLPNGDANGNKIPLMNDLIEVIEIDKLLQEHNILTQEANFELIYNQILKDGKDELARAVETKIYNYFKNLTLPEEPTLYDYLVLSLREKDLIATFNWDPFLVQAYRRNSIIKKLPKLVFLHGNVMVGYCEDDKIVGFTDCVCSKCEKYFQPSKLLYPIENKDYNSNIYIKNEWALFNKFVKYAYIFTIFGYSAPKSDVEARNTMLKTWKSNPYLEQSEIEIIDIKPEEELDEQWEEFPHSHHYTIWNDIANSFLMHQPRRSCEAMAGAFLQCKPWVQNPFPKFKSIEEIHGWLQPFIDDEIEYEKNKKSFTYKTTQFL